jgi:hypothetical protein
MKITKTTELLLINITNNYILSCDKYLRIVASRDCCANKLFIQELNASVIIAFMVDVIAKIGT